MEAVQHKAQMAKLWWKELFEYMKAKRLGNKRNNATIFRDIRERRIESLKLTRLLSTRCPMVTSFRQKYPIALGCIDFEMADNLPRLPIS